MPRLGLHTAPLQRGPLPRLRVLVAAAIIAGLALAGCGDDGDSSEAAYCDALDTLSDDVNSLTNLDVLSAGIDGVRDQLDQIRSDFDQVVESGREVASDEIDAAQSAIDNLSTAVDNLSSEGLSASNAGDVISAIGDVGPAVSAVVSTLRDACE